MEWNEFVFVMFIKSAESQMILMFNIMICGVLVPNTTHVTHLH